MGKWEMVRLADVFNLQMGKTPRRDNPKYWDNGSNKWISIADIGRVDKYISDTKERITQIAVNETGMRIVPQDTVIMSFKLSLGKTAITLESMYTNEAIMAFLDKEKYQVDIDYIYHLFCCFNWGESTNKAVMGVTLNKATLSNIKIPIPPLDEQKRIAKNLDLASEIVKGYKEQLAELDKLEQSVFYEMFGDPVTNEKGWISQSLSNSGSCKNGMNFGANESGIEIKYLGVGDFKELSIIDGVDSLSTISLMQTPSKEYLLRDEDIIFVRSNGNKNLVGRCVVVYPGDAALTFSGFCIRFRKSSDKLMTVYLLYVLKCASVRRLLLGRGANIQNLNQQILKQLAVPVPPISLQSQFIGIIAEIEGQKTQVQQALTEAENLFNSLMQEYYE